MQLHEQRVINEKEELDIKRRSLLNFLHTPTFANLPEEEGNLLVDQVDAMANYSRILTKRISLFKET